MDTKEDDSEYIPATVPIVVGCVLAAMVLVVIVAYFVGRSRQKKKAKNLSANDLTGGGESIEIGIQNPDAKSTGSSDTDWPWRKKIIGLGIIIGMWEEGIKGFSTWVK